MSAWFSSSRLICLLPTRHGHAACHEVLRLSTVCTGVHVYLVGQDDKCLHVVLCVSVDSLRRVRRVLGCAILEEDHVEWAQLHDPERGLCEWARAPCALEYEQVLTALLYFLVLPGVRHMAGFWSSVKTCERGAQLPPVWVQGCHDDCICFPWR